MDLRFVPRLERGIRELGLGIRRTKQWLCEVAGEWRLLSGGARERVNFVHTGAGALESHQLSAETTSREITGKAENEILRLLRMTIF